MGAPKTFDFEPLFKERVARLAKLVSFAPKGLGTVIAADVMLVFQAAFCVYPQEMAEAFARKQREQQRIASGFCLFCGGTEFLGHPRICSSCEREAESEAEIGRHEDESEPDSLRTLGLRETDFGGGGYQGEPR